MFVQRISNVRVIDKKETRYAYMMIKDVLKELETTKSAALAKEIGVGEKKLREGLRAAGYAYRNSGDTGWYFVGEGEQPLEKAIHDYVPKRTTNINRKPKVQGTNKVTPKEEVNNVLTPHEVSVLRDVVNEWETVKEVVNKVSASGKGRVPGGLEGYFRDFSKSEPSQQPIHSINELYVRVKQEIEPQKKMRKTLNINSGVGTALDDFAAKHKLDKQDIIELALFDFFEKYNENYTDLRKGNDEK